MLARDGYPTGLVVQADGDPMDHREGGEALAELLGHHLITVEDSGDHEVYVLSGSNPRLEAYVERYLVDGGAAAGPGERARCASGAARSRGRLTRGEGPADGPSPSPSRRRPSAALAPRARRTWRRSGSRITSSPPSTIAT
ncbi:alpha/beta hydrolase [Streptomyces tricolor]|nr:alpha/beta hydrolase [Streptomyces tricolor]